jgi:hypothetical protein
MVVHTGKNQQGTFNSIKVREEVESNNLRLVDMSVKKGDEVLPFTGANRSLGDMFFQFKTREELEHHINDTSQWMNIVLS